MSNEEKNGFFAKPVFKDFDNYLKNYVTKNLKELGFEFQSEDDFIQFISKRVTRIGFEDKPNEYELYVDYHSDNQKLIGIYNDNVSFSYEGNKVTATFGRNIAYWHWLAVSERLPKIGEITDVYISVGHRVTNYKWEDYDLKSSFMPNEITHWIPIPEPPFL